MDTFEDFFTSINDISSNRLNEANLNTYFTSAKAILFNLAKKSKVKDEFDIYYYKPTATLSCFLKSRKTETEYHLLFDLYTNEIVFFSSIYNWENIRNVSDVFWSNFILVSDSNNFKFSPDSGPFYNKENTPEFNSKYKSLLFNLMSVYITAMLEPQEERGNISFGQLEVTFTPQTPIEEMINKLGIAFKTFYGLNYQLWKTEDIRKQNRKNKRKKRNEI